MKTHLKYLYTPVNLLYSPKLSIAPVSPPCVNYSFNDFYARDQTLTLLLDNPESKISRSFQIYRKLEL